MRELANRSAEEMLGLRLDRSSPARSIALACALAALWLLGRRYAGLTHDASVYLAQGLRGLHPESIGKDLFFAFGAQDAYTIFPDLYAPLIAAFGAGGAAMAVTTLGQAAFFAACAWFVVRAVPGPSRWWSLALLATISGYYGGGGVFRLAEPFATARTLAEPLVLAAFALTLEARHAAAFSLLAAAAALHPLVAAPGIAGVLLWHAADRPRLPWTVPLAAAAALGLLFAWPGATRRLDPAWLEAVRDRSPHLFVALWQVPDWARMFWGLCIAAMAIRFVEAPVRRLLVASLTVALGGVAVSAIAVDLLDSAFAAGLQAWRAHWLMHALAIVMVPVAVSGLWRCGNAGRAAAALIAASCCFGRDGQLAAALLAALAVILDALERKRPGWMSARMLRPMLLAALGAASVGLMFEVQSRLPPVYGAMRPVQWNDYLYSLASVGGLLPVAALIWMLAHTRFRVLALAGALAALALSLAAWDARTPWSRFVEQDGEMANTLRRSLPPEAQVFWPGPGGRAWLVLQRPSWFSVDQGAGIVFNRATAIEYDARRLASRELREAMERCIFSGYRGCWIDLGHAQALCERRNGPDFLVLNAPLRGRDGIEWPLPPDIGPGRQSVYLYSCRELAAGAAAESTK